MVEAAPPPGSATPSGTAGPGGTALVGGPDPGGVVLAIDVGGTKMVAGVVDGTGRVLWSERTPTDVAAPWTSLTWLLERVPDRWAPVGCGVGCGGPMAAGGRLVSPLNIDGWRDFPLRNRVAEVTGLPTWLRNDAQALALAEGWLGAARGLPAFLSMVVSTGVGGGVVVDGRLLVGEGSNAGHIGHVVVEPGGRRCRCGGRGCLEAEASGPSIAAATGVRPEDADEATKRRTGTLVGRAVASTCHLLELRLATVAGSVALGFGDVFFAAAQEELDARVGLTFARGAVIRPSALSGDGPLVGAAAVGWEGLGCTLLAPSEAA